MDNSKVTSNPNPREKANWISISTFWWIVELFKKGYNKELGTEDLYDPLSTDRSSILGNRLEKQWKAELKNSKKGKNQPSLTKAIFRTFYLEFFFLGCLECVNEFILRLATPLLLGELLKYFKPKSMVAYENVLIYAGGMSISLILKVMTINHYIYGGVILSGKLRIAICSLAYKKALRLSKTALGDTTPGKIVNLMANDVIRFEKVGFFLHHIWSAPLTVLIIGYFMYSEAGYAALIGIAVLFVDVIIKSCTYTCSARFRLQAALRTDERVRLMDEIISGVQVIKMYAWEKPFCALVKLARRLELNVIRKSSCIRGILMTFQLFSSRMALFVTLTTTMLTGEMLAIDKVFVLSSYLVILWFTLSSMFASGLHEIAEFRVTLKRLQNFLTLEEFKSSNVTDSSCTTFTNSAISDKADLRCTIETVIDDNIISIDHVTAKWNLNSSETTLEDIHLEIEQGKLYVVIGMVGAGKSSLLSTILGELNPLQGNVTVNGSISYASQDAWMFGTSVKHNILFGQEFDKQRYNQVVQSCDLLKDFKQFRHGDQTIVGGRGSLLSGGQKARINLARALYRQADIYLLDDPLSAVDAHVGKHLFEECLQKYLKGKTRILATHQLQYLKEADSIILMDQGRMYKYSDYRELLNIHPEYNSVLAEEETEKSNVNLTAKVKQIKRQLSSTSSKSHLSDDSAVDAGAEEDSVNLGDLMEGTSRKTVKGNIMLRYFEVGSSTFMAIVVIVLFLLTQFFIGVTDYFVTILVEAKESHSYYENIHSNEAIDINSGLNVSKSLRIIEEDKLLPMNYYIYIYATIVLLIFLIGTIRSITFYTVCLRSNQYLHDLMFRALIRTGLHFFNTNPSGRILNRFSKDLGGIDDLLPICMLDAGQIMLLFFGSLIVTCTVNPFFLIPLLFIGALMYWIRQVYLKTSKNLKRLEGITRSPVFTHLNVTLNGISTIRAFRAQKILEKEFDKFQDFHTSSWFLFVSCSFAFAVFIELCNSIFTILVMLSFFFLNDRVPAEQVGLAITQLMTVSGIVQYGMRQTSETSNLLTSVERLLEYAQLPPEKNLRDIGFLEKRKQKHAKSEEKLALVEPPQDWPSTGCINFQNVYMRYSDENAPVLKGLTLTIHPSEKVGIVGRTGAGKSSLISALFRLAKVEGLIEIDGIDTGRIALEDLRSHISIIPQDPVLFSGTLRRNLDPFTEFLDEQLWEVLEEVELKDAAMTTGHGLDNPVLDRGSNYSVGQRQLVCLARAILRNNRILILDEATANVDPHTDALIQRTIRSKFAPCTVLTIAHRLNTIMDSDKILVMDRGILLEYDHPHILLQNDYGPFTSLVKETGQAMYEQLCKVAHDAYITKYGESSYL